MMFVHIPNMHTHTLCLRHILALFSLAAGYARRPMPRVFMCDAGSTWGLAVKRQPSAEVFFTDQHALKHRSSQYDPLAQSLNYQ